MAGAVSYIRRKQASSRMLLLLLRSASTPRSSICASSGCEDFLMPSRSSSNNLWQGRTEKEARWEVAQAASPGVVPLKSCGFQWHYAKLARVRPRPGQAVTSDSVDGIVFNLLCYGKGSKSPRCFAVTGIQGSSVVLTCSRWYPSQPGVMHRLSADLVKGSESWNH